MSNGAVGKLYERIIDAVIEDARHDFEESGVDSKTLDDMREIWQRNMSNMKRAQFPWEPSPPSPEPASTSIATPASTATVPSVAPKAEPALPTNNSGTSTPQLPPNNAHPIKQEQGFDASFLNLPPTGAYSQNPHYAQQRAINNIQQKFGNQVTGQLTSNQQNGHPAPYSQGPPPKRIKTEGSLSAAQTDGAFDDPQADTAADAWRSIVASKDSLTPAQRASADGMMRRQALQMQRRLEVGGLLVPLDERYSAAELTTTRKRKAVGPSHELNTSRSGHLRQVDGVADDDEDDDGRDMDSEDAINSDLDDPDDENVESALQGDSHLGDMMLCLYDKVQRVKNKWKCQLKDGVCTIGDKDYVFHKASGEFEW